MAANAIQKGERTSQSSVTSPIAVSWADFAESGSIA